MTPIIHHIMVAVIRKEGVCIVDYVEELEKVQAVCAKYMDNRGEFTFTKTGGVKRAEDEDIIEFLCGCVNDERKTLDEYRDERLNKYMM